MVLGHMRASACSRTGPAIQARDRGAGASPISLRRYSREGVPSIKPIVGRKD
ncbi:Hypothetical predicted protein [Olea europaea subsp. europaea]|uniref:Uncharacterized protein n=1 Tax=Olea europaea subsp. europaea TaxID=158383 RepID=A0A8S0TKT8_OLEEU|nr:Hypothetical predicted protein [Olea europaea subsp. europaea]